MNKENFENLMITVATLGFLISKVAVIYIAYLALKNNIAYSGWLLLVVALYVLLTSCAFKSDKNVPHD